MARIQSRAAKSKSQVRRQEVQEESTTRDRKERNYDARTPDSRDSNKPERSSDNGFVNITKLFATRKNPDNLVGTCKAENLEKIGRAHV